ncbi:MAG TPA: DsbA family protein [Candidatus Sulfotelmatobacter sp.]|nr:DsbA family protein [Candidatus Sulfotelmatobacter sp.]
MSRLLKLMALGAVMMFGAAAVSGAAQAADSFPTDHVVGKADAPNTIIEYFSLGCPHCADFHEEVWPKLKAEWVDTGKLKVIFRDFPLDGRSLAAAMVAQCSGDRYLAFVDAYFRTQNNWGRADDGLTAIKQVAKLGGMGDAQVDACWQKEDLLKQINDRADDAKKRGVNSTPTFYVNGKVINGTVPYENYVKELH